MEVLRISGGHRFRLRHGPSLDIQQVKRPNTVAFSPRGLKFLKPKVLVKEGDLVALGQPVVHHKKDPRIQFTSPAAGKVREVRYGPRRVLEAIVIDIDESLEKSQETLKKYHISQIENLKKSETEKFLLDHGYWGYVNCFPKNHLAPQSTDAEESSGPVIDAIHINLTSCEPHCPKPEIVVNERMQELVAGIHALSKLALKTRVYVPKGFTLPNEINALATVIGVREKYPAENLGVQAWYAAKIKDGHCVIGSDAELTIDIGHHLLTGKKRTERLYSLAGNAAKSPKHYLGRLGMTIGDLVGDQLSHTENVRLIAGGLFSGEKVRFQDYLGPNDTALQAMVEDTKRIPFVFFRLGADRFTMSRTWLSGFKNDALREATTSNNGEERACVQCGYCIKTCPVQLMPNLIMKAAAIKDIEKMESLFIHDCVDCGLCTFVCPSKIELGQRIEEGKKLIEKEG